MDEQKQRLHEMIDNMSNPKWVNYIYNLIKSFIELRS